MNAHDSSPTQPEHDESPMAGEKAHARTVASVKQFALTHKKIFLVSLVAFFIMGGTALALWSQRDKSSPQEPQQQAQAQKSLKIESDPAGIAMIGQPECDSSRLEKQTPYTCTIGQDVKETFMSAPAEIEQDGKKYYFVRWDDCSETNEDIKICRVIFEETKEYTIKASYTTDKPAASSAAPSKKQPGSPTPQSAPPSSTPDVDGHQCEKSLKLVPLTNTGSCTVSLPEGYTQVGLYTYGYLAGSQYHLGSAFQPALKINCNTAACGSSPKEAMNHIDFTVNGAATTITFSFPIEQAQTTSEAGTKVLAYSKISVEYYRPPTFPTKIGHIPASYYVSIQYNEKAQ